MLPVNGDEHAQGKIQGLPFKAVAPGLITIGLIDLLALFGRWSDLPGNQAFQLATLFLAPWLALLATRRGPQVLGFRRRNLLLDLGWGAVAGGIWRGASLLLNLLLLGWSTSGDPVWRWGSALVWVPLLEETFFRGYLGWGLRAHLGPRKAVLLQAILFAFQPSHLAQGWPGVASIFGFGLLAGWLTERRGSIWSAWGAHAFANALIIPLEKFA